MLRAIAVLGVLLLSAACPVRAQKPDERKEEADIEAQVLKALSTGSLIRLQAAAEDARDLKPDQPSRLKLQVRPGSIEFRFRGEFPADKVSLEGVEYLASSAAKDYESLLVVGPEELARLKKVGEALAALKKAGKQAVLEYKLIWVEDKRARVEDLQKIMGLLEDAERKRFFEQLRFNEHGLGGSLNTKADPAVLPARRIAAELLLTVRLR